MGNDVMRWLKHMHVVERNMKMELVELCDTEMGNGSDGAVQKWWHDTW